MIRLWFLKTTLASLLVATVLGAGACTASTPTATTTTVSSPTRGSIPSPLTVRYQIATPGKFSETDQKTLKQRYVTAGYKDASVSQTGTNQVSVDLGPNPPTANGQMVIRGTQETILGMRGEAAVLPLTGFAKANCPTSGGTPVQVITGQGPIGCATLGSAPPAGTTPGILTVAAGVGPLTHSTATLNGTLPTELATACRQHAGRCESGYVALRIDGQLVAIGALGEGAAVSYDGGFDPDTGQATTALLASQPTGATLTIPGPP